MIDDDNNGGPNRRGVLDAWNRYLTDAADWFDSGSGTVLTVRRYNQLQGRVVVHHHCHTSGRLCRPHLVQTFKKAVLEAAAPGSEWTDENTSRKIRPWRNNQGTIRSDVTGPSAIPPSLTEMPNLK